MSLQPTLFRNASTPAEAGAPDPSRLLAGRPVHALRNHYTDRTGQFLSGEWSSTVGRWQVRCDPREEEFCILLEGTVRLEAADGQVHEMHAGDAFVVPAGFEGIWENITPVRKFYAVMALKA